MCINNSDQIHIGHFATFLYASADLESGQNCDRAIVSRREHDQRGEKGSPILQPSPQDAAERNSERLGSNWGLDRGFSSLAPQQRGVGGGLDRGLLLHSGEGGSGGSTGDFSAWLTLLIHHETSRSERLILLDDILRGSPSGEERPPQASPEPASSLSLSQETRGVLGAFRGGETPQDATSADATGVRN